MIRVILEVIYLVSIIYLSLLYFRLFKDVVKLRRELQTPIGYKSEQLQRAIRAHSNFCETVPLILILSFILYFNNILYFAVPIVIILAFGRTIHSRAILSLNEDLKKRVVGMKMTTLSLKLAIVGILFYIIQVIYYGYLAYTSINS